MVPQFNLALIFTIKGDDTYGFMCKKKEMSIESSTYYPRTTKVRIRILVVLVLSYYENDKEQK